MTGQRRLTEGLCAAVLASLAGGAPKVPEGATPLWNAFCELDAARTWHAHGPNPIAFTEIEAWSRLTRWPLEPRHVAMLRAMDLALLGELRGGGAPAGRRSAGTLTPALFDAITG